MQEHLKKLRALRADLGDLQRQVNDIINSIEQEALTEMPVQSAVPLVKVNEQAKERMLEDYAACVRYLNEQNGSKYRESVVKGVKDIAVRCVQLALKQYTLQDIYDMIDYKIKEWKGSDMAKYLRPITLFGSKLQNYIEDSKNVKLTGNSKNGYKKLNG